MSYRLMRMITYIVNICHVDGLTINDCDTVDKNLSIYIRIRNFIFKITMDKNIIVSKLRWIRLDTWLFRRMTACKVCYMPFFFPLLPFYFLFIFNLIRIMSSMISKVNYIYIRMKHNIKFDAFYLTCNLINDALYLFKYDTLCICYAL